MGIQGRSSYARCLQIPPQSRFYRSTPRPRQGVQGPKDAWSHGRVTCYRQETACHAHQRGRSIDYGQGRCAGTQGTSARELTPIIYCRLMCDRQVPRGQSIDAKISCALVWYYLEIYCWRGKKISTIGFTSWSSCQSFSYIRSSTNFVKTLCFCICLLFCY